MLSTNFKTYNLLLHKYKEIEASIKSKSSVLCCSVNTVNFHPSKFAVALGNCRGFCQGKSVFSLMCTGKLFHHTGINYCKKLKNLHFCASSEQTPIIAIVTNKKKKNEGKTKKLWSADKTLVRMEESAGTFVGRCSVNKAFLKNCIKFTRKYLCWSLFLMKFQALRRVFLLKSDSSKCVPVNFTKFLKASIL